MRGGVGISSPPSENAAKLIYCLKDGPEGEGGGGNSRKFYAGRLRPKVQPLTLIYILSKGRPRAGEELKKVFYGEAPPKGPAPYPYLYTVKRKAPSRERTQESILRGGSAQGPAPYLYLHYFRQKRLPLSNTLLKEINDALY